jgi:hypothetical protein
MLRPEDCIPGTLVECIRNHCRVNGKEVLVLRRVYTIRQFYTGLPGGGAITVHEVHIAGTVGSGPCKGSRGFITWGIANFRLLPDERLSVFRKMLEPAPTKETV